MTLHVSLFNFRYVYKLYGLVMEFIADDTNKIQIIAPNMFFFSFFWLSRAIYHYVTVCYCATAKLSVCVYIPI